MRLASGLPRSARTRRTFDGAVVVTSPQTGEVRAIVGGRQRYEGFNRALDARRPIGSLIKPVIYLAALESGATRSRASIDDAPIDVKLDSGTCGRPHDFDERRPAATCRSIRALAESLNLATVRLGLDVGLEPIAESLVGSA